MQSMRDSAGEGRIGTVERMDAGNKFAGQAGERCGR